MKLTKFCWDIYWKHIDLFAHQDTRSSKWIIFFSCLLLIWVVGILSNLVNVLVFGHKNMAQRHINLIFWWLSISDLLEQAILALYQWLSGWNGELGIIAYRTRRGDIYDCVLILICKYLFQVSHTITIGLNIILVFRQYMVVAHPLKNQRNPINDNDRSAKLAVIWIYILSFILYLPFCYVYKIECETNDYRSNKSTPPCKIVMRELSYMSDYVSEDPLVDICMLVYGIVLRIGLLIILIILCALLLFAIQNTHRKRQNLGMQASHLSKAQRKVNRMNVTILVIIIMFLITDIPLGISSFPMLDPNLSPCLTLINFFFIFPFILLNCCYNIFCYLIRIKEYRETLKLLLSKSSWVSSRAPVTKQTDL